MEGKQSINPIDVQLTSDLLERPTIKVLPLLFPFPFPSSHIFQSKPTHLTLQHGI